MWLCLLLKLGLPEQAVRWFPLRFGLVVEDKPTEFSCSVLPRKILRHDIIVGHSLSGDCGHQSVWISTIPTSKGIIK